jgi:NUMOD4 motif
MTHDTTDVVLVAQLDNGIEVLIEDDHSIVIFGPDEVEPGHEGDPWADDGAHIRHVNVDTLNFTADEARHIASALIHAADHLDLDDDERTMVDLDDGDAHANGKHCRTVCDCHDEISDPDCPCYDGRAPEQHMSDVAAATLARLQRLGEELGHLEGQLGLLGDWAAEHGHADRGELLTDRRHRPPARLLCPGGGPRHCGHAAGARDRLRHRRPVTNTPPERWRPAPGYESMYEVSDLGRVRGLPRRARICPMGVESFRHVPGKIRRPKRRYPGDRWRIKLSRNGIHTDFDLAEIVLEAFEGMRPPGCRVEYRNGDKGDCTLANLAWTACRDPAPRSGAA